MAIVFTCDCGHEMLAGDACAGMHAECPRCGRPCVVPAAASPAAGSDDRAGERPKTARAGGNIEAGGEDDASARVCAACGEEIAFRDAVACVRCKAWYHAECRRKLESCTAPGCGGTKGGGLLSSAPGVAAERRPCPVCRRLIPRNAQRCRFCGEFVDPHLRAASRKRFRYPRKTSYLAGTSIILALVSLIAMALYWDSWLLWPCLLGPLASLAIGVWAVSDIERAAGEKSGYWMAGFGLFLGTVALLKWLVEFFW